MPPKPISTNPKTIASRKWYALHKDDPGVKEKNRLSCRKWRAKYRNSKRHKKRKAELDLRYHLSVRDSKEFRDKRNVFNVKYRQDPVIYQNSKESVRNWEKNNREKVRAHAALNYAIRTGKVIRPKSCILCGDTPPLGRDGRSQLHAHHEDYSKPFDVDWLCAFCHGNTRRKR